MESSSKVRDWHSEPFRVLVTLGESTTAGGWSSSRERCWANVLADLISDFQDEPVKLVNSGIGANVISTQAPLYEFSGKPAANERVGKHVIAHDPDLLVISYGLNDARGGTPVEMFREELTSVIDAIRKECDPLIVSARAVLHDGLHVVRALWLRQPCGVRIVQLCDGAGGRGYGLPIR